MKKKVNFIVLISIFLVYFQSYSQRSEFNFDTLIIGQLPSVDYVLNEDYLASAYSLEKVITTSGTNNPNANSFKSTFYKSDIKATDAKNLINHYFNYYLIKNEHEKYGSIETKVLLQLEESKFCALGNLLIFSTLFIGVILGIPAEKYVTTVEIETSIYNINHHLISKYIGSGVAVKYISLYTGTYKRKNNIKAVKLAIADINYQILRDHPYLKNKLRSE